MSNCMRCDCKLAGKYDVLCEACAVTHEEERRGSYVQLLAERAMRDASRGYITVNVE
jgi:hypothetical protein